MSGMTKPRVGDMARLVRAARYLKGPPICEWWYKFQKPGRSGLPCFVLSDADHASDEETGRSTSCYHLYLGGLLVESESCKQKVIALSSSEAASTLLDMAVLQGSSSGRLRLPWASFDSSQGSQSR